MEREVCHGKDRIIGKMNFYDYDVETREICSVGRRTENKYE